MMKINKLFAALSIVAASVSPSAFAASSVDISVIGSIIPSACTPSLSTASVDLGKISVSDLDATANTQLPTQTVGFSVACNAPAQFALQAVDNNPASALIASDQAFGLGLGNQSEKIGYFGMRFLESSLTADSTPVIGLASTDKTNWAAAPISGPEGGNGPAISHGSNYLGFGDAGSTVVKAIEQLQGSLEVRAVIAPADSLDTSTEVAIDGSATIEVIYL